MFIKNWKRELFTIPNLLSLFRLVLIPLYVKIYLNASESFEYLLAGGIMALSCLTDLMDGKIARHFHQITNLGKILDPLADKITQFVLTFCLSLKYPVLTPVLALFVVKEIFQLVMGVFNLLRGKMLPGALVAGKACTAVLFTSLIALVLFPRLDNNLVSAIATADGLFLVISFVSYFLAYFGREAKVQNLNQE